MIVSWLQSRALARLAVASQEVEDESLKFVRVVIDSIMTVKK